MPEIHADTESFSFLQRIHEDSSTSIEEIASHEGSSVTELMSRVKGAVSDLSKAEDGSSRTVCRDALKKLQGLVPKDSDVDCQVSAIFEEHCLEESNPSTKHLEDLARQTSPRDKKRCAERIIKSAVKEAKENGGGDYRELVEVLIDEKLISGQTAKLVLENFQDLGLHQWDVGRKLAFVKVLDAGRAYRAFTVNFDKMGFQEELEKCATPQEKLSLLLHFTEFNRVGANILGNHASSLKIHELPYHEKLQLYSETSSFRENVKKYLKENFEKMGFAQNLGECSSVEDRLARLNEIVGLGAWSEAGLAENFEHTGFIEDFQKCENQEARLELLQKIWTDHPVIASGLLNHFEKLGFEGHQAEVLHICKQMIQQDMPKAVFDNLEKFGFDADQVLDICNAAVTVEGGKHAEVVAENINHPELMKIPTEDRIELYSKLAADFGRASWKLREQYESPAMMSLPINDRLAIRNSIELGIREPRLETSDIPSEWLAEGVGSLEGVLNEENRGIGTFLLQKGCPPENVKQLLESVGRGELNLQDLKTEEALIYLVKEEPFSIEALKSGLVMVGEILSGSEKSEEEFFRACAVFEFPSSDLEAFKDATRREVLKEFGKGYYRGDIYQEVSHSEYSVVDVIDFREKIASYIPGVKHDRQDALFGRLRRYHLLANAMDLDRAVPLEEGSQECSVKSEELTKTYPGDQNKYSQLMNQSFKMAQQGLHDKQWGFTSFIGFIEFRRGFIAREQGHTNFYDWGQRAIRMNQTPLNIVYAPLADLLLAKFNPEEIRGRFALTDPLGSKAHEVLVVGGDPMYMGKGEREYSVHLEHATPAGTKACMQGCEERFNRIMAADDMPEAELKEELWSFFCEMCRSKAWSRGDPSIAEIAIRAIYLEKTGNELPGWKEGVVPWMKVYDSEVTSLDQIMD